MTCHTTIEQTRTAVDCDTRQSIRLIKNEIRDDVERLKSKLLAYQEDIDAVEFLDEDIEDVVALKKWLILAKRGIQLPL
ncbi:hypothetical protein [Poriferisphaera sp. WC338]|uniref:hypothetical protein n=1 Tax=Poriferisphaera sp. WC338 TaxID=3425129 RepID=UPI003D8159DF